MIKLSAEIQIRISRESVFTVENQLVNLMNKQRIKDKDARKMYRKLQKVCRDIEIDNARFRDKEMIVRTLSALLVTEPINGNALFNVDRRAFLDPALDGQDFTIESLKFTPNDSMVGGRYYIHFYALSPKNRFYYEFVGELRDSSPYLIVEEAVLDEVPSDGINTSVE